HSVHPAEALRAPRSTLGIPGDSTAGEEHMNQVDGPKFRPGDPIRLVSHPERVGVIVGQGEWIQGRYWYRVHFGPGRIARHPETDIEPVEGVSDDIEGMLLERRFGSRDAFAKLVTHLKLTQSLRSEIYSLHASRTTFYPHQFKPI